MAECYIAELSKPYLELTLNIVYDRYYIPSMAAGAMPRIRQIARAIRSVENARPQIKKKKMFAVPGEEQMAIGRGAMEDEAVRSHRKTGGAELWKIVE